MCRQVIVMRMKRKTSFSKHVKSINLFENNLKKTQIIFVQDFQIILKG